MKFISILPWLAVLLLSTACSTSGTKIQTEKLSSIQRGITTEQEIIAAFGEPDSVTTTPERKVLVYTYQENNSTQKSLLGSTGSMVGGLVAGPIGSVAGSLAAHNAMPSQANVEVLSVELDAKTGKVMNYQFQQTQ